MEDGGGLPGPITFVVYMVIVISVIIFLARGSNSPETKKKPHECNIIMEDNPPLKGK